MAILSDAERDAVLADLPGWSYDREHTVIARTFRFADFNAAFAFMTRAALAAEKADHHPDWRNVWNRVEVSLSTHDAGGVTAKDIALAAEMDRFAAPLAEPGSAD